MLANNRPQGAKSRFADSARTVQNTKDPTTARSTPRQPHQIAQEERAHNFHVASEYNLAWLASIPARTPTPACFATPRTARGSSRLADQNALELQPRNRQQVDRQMSASLARFCRNSVNHFNGIILRSLTVTPEYITAVPPK